MRYITPHILLACFVAAILATAPQTAAAKNIDLSTVPPRASVQLTIYNGEDLTLVRETRAITFKKGNNPLQFSWANTLIDPTSVELRFLTNPAELELLDTTYPHDKPQMLYWNVTSEFAGEATVEISYFTSGIAWSSDYTAIANADESAMALTGYVTVSNNSGEDYQDAQVRLVVGKVNLVEKITQLAQQGVGNMPRPSVGAKRKEKVLRHRAMKSMIGRAEMSMDAAAPDVLEEAAQIVKEGLSEYFIFTIEGTQDVPNRFRKRLRSFGTEASPMDVAYRYRPQEYGDQLVRLFLLKNNEEAELGESPLPNGVVRVFRQKPSGGLAYLTQQSVQYIPIGDRIELNLGVDKEVVFELERLHTFRDNIWGTFQRNVRQRLDAPGVKIRDNGRVTAWDQHTIYAQRVRNYTGKPITLEVRRPFHGDVRFAADQPAKKHDAHTVQYVMDAKPAQEVELLFQITERQGENHKQNRIEVARAKPAAVPWR